MHKKVMVGIFVFLVSVSMVFADGFSIYEHGAKSMSLCGAFTAQANDVTAVFFNPAGITQLSGLNFGLSGTYIVPKASFLGPTSVDPNLYQEAKSWNFFVPSLYATYAITEDLSAGFGFFVPFGLGTDWGKDWVGKQLATKSEVQTMFYNLNVAYKVAKGLSLAAGVDFVTASITLDKMAYFAPRSLWGSVELKGDATSWGYNVAAHYQATDYFSLGVSFRSNVSLDIDGTAKFKFPSVSPVVDAEIASLFPESKGTSKIKLPTFLIVGAAIKPIEELTVEADWFQIGWSSYDKLAVDFKKETAAVTDQSSPKDWKNTNSFRLGAEYRWNEKIAIRLGADRDLDPSPDKYVDPSLPGAPRWLFSIGGGYKVNDNLTVDLGYMYLIQDDRTIKDSAIDFNGTYKSLGSLTTLTLSYSLK
jgi:long-chain fatty acid transport protein